MEEFAQFSPHGFLSSRAQSCSMSSLRFMTTSQSTFYCMIKFPLDTVSRSRKKTPPCDWLPLFSFWPTHLRDFVQAMHPSINSPSTSDSEYLFAQFKSAQVPTPFCQIAQKLFLRCHQLSKCMQGTPAPAFVTSYPEMSHMTLIFLLGPITYKAGDEIHGPRPKTLVTRSRIMQPI